VNISIVSGWLPFVVRCLAVALVVVVVDWRSVDGRRHIGRALLISVLVTGGTTAVLALASVVPSDVPWSALVWGFTLILAVCVTALHWRGARRWRRVCAVAAVVLTLLVTLDTIDQHSGSFPTLERLVTLDPENVVGTPQLQQIRAQVAATGVLPDQGVVFTVTIPAKISHFATRPATVYLPPAWFAKATPSLPTLVLLPGEPGSASDWSDDGHADNIADAFANSHHGVAPIIVMPDPNGLLTDDSECVNSKFGNAETYLVEDVPAFARSQFNASGNSGSLAIAGLSAGGTCSVMLALRHPQVYPTFASYSGFASPQFEEATQAVTVDTLFGGSEEEFAAHDPSQLLRDGHFDGMAGWFEVGNQDVVPAEAARSLQAAASGAGIATCILVRPGGHDFDLWSQALVDSFPWLTWRLGLTAAPAHEPASCTSP